MRNEYSPAGNTAYQLPGSRHSHGSPAAYASTTFYGTLGKVSCFPQSWHQTELQYTEKSNPFCKLAISRGRRGGMIYTGLLGEDVHRRTNLHPPSVRQAISNIPRVSTAGHAPYAKQHQGTKSNSVAAATPTLFHFERSLFPAHNTHENECGPYPGT